LIIGSLFKGIGLIGHEARENQQLIHAYINADQITEPTNYHALGIEGPLYCDEEITNEGLPRPQKDLDNIRDRMGCELRGLKAMMEKLEEEGIPCWLECGTALGAYRHGGMIPWDKDIDIAILLKDHRNFKIALKNHLGDRIDIQDWSPPHFPGTGYKIYFKDTGYIIDVYTYDVKEPSGEDPIEEPDQEEEMLTLKMNGVERQEKKVDPAKVWRNLSQEPTLHYQFSEDTWMPESWKKRERECQHPRPINALFPLKKARFDYIDEEGHLSHTLMPVPNQIKPWLESIYGLLAPSKFYDETAKKYKPVEGHPYWMEHDPDGMLE
jgi:hypothetical protein